MPLNLDCYKDYDERRSRLPKQRISQYYWTLQVGHVSIVVKWKKTFGVIPKFIDLINEELVLISLYVDDREPLAKEDQFTLEYTSGRIRNIETIGQKWAAFQAINFNSVAQPHYILMMPDGTVLAPPQQYTDIPTYLQWLQNGLANVPRQALGFKLE